MPSTTRSTHKNRTIRIPAGLLQRVQVKLAREDRKLNGLVVEQLERWAGPDSSDGLTPGQRLVREMAELRKRVNFKVPAKLDKSRLMGESDE
jgi:hypothetical protein